jgi:hypothetical protein
MSIARAEAEVPARAAGVVDFDLHGLAAIRTVGATSADAVAVRRQLGPLEAIVDRAPDVVIRFVDRNERSSRLRYIGLDDAAFTDDAFLVLRSKHKSSARVRIDFRQIGGPTEIICERGLAAVPLLIPILNLTLLAKGILPLHASAFVHEGTGVVATGWSKGGKTEALLGFAAQGAEYVGDEWVYVAANGARVYGIPQPVRIWQWQLRQLPEYARLVGTGERARLRALDVLVRAERVLQPADGRLTTLLKRQRYVDMAPERLFGRLGPMSAPFDRLFFLMSHESNEVVVEPADASEIGRRMAFSLRHESLDLLAAYLKFRFAFPDASSHVIDHAAALESDALSHALAGKPAFLVRHPYPVSLSALFDSMKRYCE